MPLSEEELRLLEQMERALVEEDPKFASTLRGTTLRQHARRRAFGAGVVFLGGVALLMTGAVVQLWYVGVVGFVLMLASATVALGAMRGGSGATVVPDDPRAAHPSGLTLHQGGKGGERRPRRTRSRSSGSFMERVEERWRRRRESGGF